MRSRQITYQELAARWDIPIDHAHLLEIVAELYSFEYFRVQDFLQDDNDNDDAMLFSPQSAGPGGSQQDDQTAHMLQGLQHFEDGRMPDFTDSAALPPEWEFNDLLLSDWVTPDVPDPLGLFGPYIHAAPDYANPATNEGLGPSASGECQGIHTYVDPMVLEYHPSSEAEEVPGNVYFIDAAMVNPQGQQPLPSVEKGYASTLEQQPKGKALQSRAPRASTATKRAAPNKAPRRKPTIKKETAAPKTPTAKAGTKRIASNTEKGPLPEETTHENIVENVCKDIIRCSQEIRTNSLLLSRVNALAVEGQDPRTPSGGGRSQRAQAPKREVANRQEELSTLREECDHLADNCERVANDADRIARMAQAAAKNATLKFKRSPTPYPRDLSSPVPEAQPQPQAFDDQWIPPTPLPTSAQKPGYEGKDNKNGDEKATEPEQELESRPEFIPAEQQVQQQPDDNNNKKQGEPAVRPRRSSRVRKPSLRALGL
ncbi:hypothetical protein VTN00DRAFT_9518 [Thermoascus crustaceus]|uniref:uncharacterized protein n=1 Tax=Thermoascus crustaceus TaxID=5088 RepID=UPI0037431A2D